MDVDAPINGLTYRERPCSTLGEQAIAADITAAAAIDFSGLICVSLRRRVPDAVSYFSPVKSRV